MSTDSPTVLVVQNDLPTQELLTEMLESDGYAVELAATAAAGLARLGTTRVDLVVSDFTLPDMSGLELCVHVRSRTRTNRVPVVLLSGWSDQSHEVAGYAAGADAYVLKPFDVEALLSVVRGCCGPRPL
jgi:two-component system phosphate regulon response regulator PhoB